MGWLVNSHRLVTCSLTALSLVAGSSAVAAQTAPPAFTASPFSAEFVIVGTQEGVGVPVRPRKRRWNVRRTDGRAGALAGPRR